MKSSVWPWRQVATGLLATMLFEGGQWTTALAQQSTPSSPAAQSQVPGNSGDPSSGTSDQNTGTSGPAAAYPDAPVAQSNAPSQPQLAAQPQSASQQSQQDQQQNVKPLGTAAAPYTQPSGVMASRPAGAVIAPGRQRRIHTIVISVAIIAAAGIAIGTVSALSHGSPSRP